ncbi:RNA polymerase sigma factor [Cryptosporangium aurantiacum]|uniref:DNA-directed RNA polymerase specialized sigma subunit, sigma24 family n=1 Tax=Cryptosporangium aurantiacum TaxID=134849 RepID=A0A1M7IZL9_9ACTN|nr:hypothetical protein [Cryptosporangium aurantiacum]SHM46250.1 DNA-directed RNA polymerase specialized sigma subunit, sigma24 family [Cryptosporangium aurantiacum]
MDDVALVAAVQRGNEEALADLFEECHGWTYSTCLNALRDPDAAEEATARVFEVAVRTRLAGARTLRAAMIRLIYDACIEVEHEILRKRWLRRKGEQPPAAPDPKDLRLVAWRAAGDLTGPDRILFALAAAAELTTESIAVAVEPGKPSAIEKRLGEIREHVVADVIAARSLDDCPDLRDTLRYAAKEPDHAARKKVHAHVAGRGKVPPCPKCSTTYERWPLAALAALLPLTAVPAGMNDRLLDRMELALRAGLAAGTDRVRAVTGSHAVIDGATAELVTPRRPPFSTPPPRHTARPAGGGGQAPYAAAPPHSEAPASRGSAARDTYREAPASASRTAPGARSSAERGPRGASDAREPRGASDARGPRGASDAREPRGASDAADPRSGAAAGAAAASGAAAFSGPATATMDRPVDDDPTQVLPTANATPSDSTGPSKPSTSTAPGGPAKRPTPADAKGPVRYRPFATTATIAVTVLVLGAVGIAALATHGRPEATAESLATDRKPPAVPAESPAAAAATSVAPSPSPRSTTPAADDEEPTARTSPSASARTSIRPISGSTTPKPSTDPFRTFGTLTVISPAHGGSVALYDYDARLASVTLSVAVPEGFDAALLNATLTWSGTYTLQQETQYVELGSGQNLPVDLAAAQRCNTVWTITATLTPPTGKPQHATTEITLTAC